MHSILIDQNVYGIYSWVNMDLNNSRNVGLDVTNQIMVYGMRTPPATYPAICTDCGHGLSSTFGLGADGGLGGIFALIISQARRDMTRRFELDREADVVAVVVDSNNLCDGDDEFVALAKDLAPEILLVVKVRESIISDRMDMVLYIQV